MGWFRWLEDRVAEIRKGLRDIAPSAWVHVRRNWFGPLGNWRTVLMIMVAGRTFHPA